MSLFFIAKALTAPRIWARIAVTITILGATFAGAQQLALAQESKTGHVHYKKTGDFDKPAPSGAVAPRLQNLGKHTFPVSTTNKDA